MKTPRFPLVALLCLAGLSVHAAAEQAFTAMLAWPNGDCATGIDTSEEG
ncbi:MAG: hypothetical protein NTV08_19390 [Verrucomicrobia bacterium]|nr:hypothetical protein [Verrucomicrobiota bacterium]